MGGHVTNDRDIISSATPGPWIQGGPEFSAFVFDDEGEQICSTSDPSLYPYAAVNANAAFIARARTAWPDSLDRIAELEGVLARALADVSHKTLVLGDTIRDLKEFKAKHLPFVDRQQTAIADMSRQMAVADASHSRLAAEVERLREAADVAARSLVRALWLYPHYRLDSRGPSGCVWDAIVAIAPDVAGDLDRADPNEVHKQRWPDPEDDDNPNRTVSDE